MNSRRLGSLLRRLFQRTCKPLTTRRQLAFERCESREVFAGNVVASLVGTTLTVTGDGAANSVLITKPNATTVTVTGLATNVNGLAAPANFTGVVNLSVNTSAGDDSLVIARDLVTANNILNAFDLIDYSFASTPDIGTAMFGNVTIQGGNGTDQILLQMATSGNVSVADAGGIDQIALIGSTILGTYTVNSGADMDFVMMGSSRVASSVNYSLGAGNDYSYNEKIFTGPWTVDLGAGTNSIEVFGANTTGALSALPPLTINGNSDVDAVVLQGSRFRTIDISLGGAGDFVAWWGSVRTTGNVSIKGGDGDDSIAIDQFAGGVSRIGGNLTIDAGNGINTVSIGFTTRTTLKTIVTGFVSITGGTAADRIEAYGVQTSASLFVTSGSGSDTVIIQYISATTELMVDLGAGNDNLTLRNVTTNKATLRGGTNRDRLRLLGTNTITTLDQSEFEL